MVGKIKTNDDLWIGGHGTLTIAAGTRAGREFFIGSLRVGVMPRGRIVHPTFKRPAPCGLVEDGDRDVGHG
jgi:hypothetical protein